MGVDCYPSLIASLLIQLPSNSPGKAAEFGLSAWVFVIPVADPDESPGPCFDVAQCWPFIQVTWGVNQQMQDLSLSPTPFFSPSPSPYNSDFQHNKFFKKFNLNNILNTDTQPFIIPEDRTSECSVDSSC